MNKDLSNPYQPGAAKQERRKTTRDLVGCAIVSFSLFAFAVLALVWGYQRLVRLERQIREQQDQKIELTAPATGESTCLDFRAAHCFGQWL